MAYTVMNFDGLGQGLSNIANILAQGPSMAVEADLNRHKRNALVAQTALDTQKHSRIGASDQRSQEFLEWLKQPDIAAVMATPEGRAAFEAGLVQFSDTGPVLPDARNAFGAATMIAPDMVDDADLSTMGFGAGTSWQSTPSGVAAGLANDLEKQRIANEGELQKSVLSTILGGAPGGTNKGFAPMNVDGEDAATLAASVDEYLAREHPGMNYSPEVRSALLAEAGREAAQSHSIIGAVERAAARLTFDKAPPKENIWFPNYKPELVMGAPPVDAPPMAGAANVPGNAVIMQLLQSLGVDAGQIGQAPAPTGPAPGSIVGAPIPDTMLPPSLRSGDFQEGEEVASPTPGAPRLKYQNGKWVRIE